MRVIASRANSCGDVFELQSDKKDKVTVTSLLDKVCDLPRSPPSPSFDGLRSPSLWPSLPSRAPSPLDTKDGVLVRVEDQNGETPIHKLARFKITEENKASRLEAYKKVFYTIIKKTRNEAKEADRTLWNDINKQDAKGKTPMFHAIEMKNLVLIELLNGLDARDRPDGLLVTAAGWSMLHQAVNTDDFGVVKEVVKGLQQDGGRLRILINLKDKAGRQPLHIAAYKCDDEVYGIRATARLPWRHSPAALAPQPVCRRAPPPVSLGATVRLALAPQPGCRRAPPPGCLGATVRLPRSATAGAA